MLVPAAAMPFPQMRSALNNGQVDAIWTPEPFLSQALNIDNARIVMAPGPVMGNYTRSAAIRRDRAGRRRTGAWRRGSGRPSTGPCSYAQSHPDEIRAAASAWHAERAAANLEPGRRPREAPVARQLSRKYGVITRMPNMKQLVPEQHRQRARPARNGAGPARAAATRRPPVTRLTAGPYTFVVTDNSRTQNFTLKGSGVNRQTSVRGRGRSTWTVNLRKGTYRYWSSASPGAKKSFRVG